MTTVGKIPAILPGLLLWLLLPMAGSVSARPAAPYGADYAMAGALWASELPPEEPPLQTGTTETLRSALTALQARVEALESRDGPYAASLGEPLGDLGRLLDALGQEREARAARERALHLTRINEGLYSETQAPLVRELLSADRRRGDLEALDSRYTYYFRLYGRGRAPFNELRLRAALEYLRWQREAIRREVGSDSVGRLLDLYETGGDLLAALRVEGVSDQPIDGAVPWPWFRDATLSHLRTLYLIADFLGEEPQLDSPFAPPRVNNDFADFDPRRERLTTIGRGLRREADALLEDAIAAAPAALPAERAALLREHGDWLLWQGDSADAAERYGASWELLQGAGETALARLWFDRPRPVPDNGAFWDAAREAEAQRLQASLRVDRFGQVNDLEVSAVGEAGERRRRRLYRLLRETRFRPALDGGVPVQSQTFSANFLVFE